MKKEIYLIECQKLVFFGQEKPVKKMLVRKDQLIDLLDSEYIVYSAVLLQPDQIEQYQQDDIIDWQYKNYSYKFDM